MSRRQPNFGTPTCYKYGRCVTLCHNRDDKFRSASFSIDLPGSLRHSTSVARSPNGSISVQTIEVEGGSSLGPRLIEPVDPRAFWTVPGTMRGSGSFGQRVAGPGIEESIRDPKDVIAHGAMQGDTVRIRGPHWSRQDANSRMRRRRKSRRKWRRRRTWRSIMGRVARTSSVWLPLDTSQEASRLAASAGAHT